MERIKVLVANNHLRDLGGSETFTYTVIQELVRRNFDVEYFTFEFGIVSDKIEKELHVKFKSKESYDLILANHNTCVEKLYKYGFIIQTCHGIFPKLEQPSSRANAFVSISTEVQNHLAKLGFPSILIHNSIDLDRFKPIKPINKKLKTVLSLCHSEEANEFVEKACLDMGLQFLKAYKYHEAVWDVEKRINEADLIVGLGRSAYEAMACGRPVIIFDNRSYFESCGDGYVRDKLGFSLQNNCSGRYFKNKFTLELLKKEIQKYNSEDSFFFRDFAEKELDVVSNIDHYIHFWEDCIKNNLRRKREKKERLFQVLLGGKRTRIFITKVKRFKF